MSREQNFSMPWLIKYIILLNIIHLNFLICVIYRFLKLPYLYFLKFKIIVITIFSIHFHQFLGNSDVRFKSIEKLDILIHLQFANNEEIVKRFH